MKIKKFPSSNYSMFLYQYFEETNNHVLLLEMNQGSYCISYQYMSHTNQPCSTPCSTFYENKPATIDEHHRMSEMIYIMGHKYNVPDSIISHVVAHLR